MTRSDADAPWVSAPPHPNLSAGEVHVWRAEIEGRRDLEALSATLTEEESQRARRYVFPRDRDRFIAARGLLRQILSRYLGRAASDIRFRYSAYGKPSLESDVAGEQLEFNVSHAERLALFAVALGRNVGVDVEFVRENFDEEEIASRFFSRHEVSTLLGLAPSLRKEGFFTCWTRKEAYIKAIGEGLSMPLSEFDVSLEPGSPARLLATRRPLDSNWTMAALDPGPGYVGAVAFEGDPAVLRLWHDNG